MHTFFWHICFFMDIASFPSQIRPGAFCFQGVILQHAFT